MQNIDHDHRYATFASQPILEMMEISTSNPLDFSAPPSVPSVVPATPDILDSTLLAVSSSPPPIFVSLDMLTVPSSPPPIRDVSGTFLFKGSMPSSLAMPGQRSSSGPSLLTIPSSPPPICDVSGSMPSSSAMPGQRSSSGPSSSPSLPSLSGSSSSSGVHNNSLDKKWTFLLSYRSRLRLRFKLCLMQ
ncbi:pectinesterase inhibitor 10-like [Anopheles merus]|uniref:pectinesterase inhibitor 10-like n=1 Tax=Anopheles merus TaxID=30066 RepID=UPI001BE4310C|nr:pectinesterase inhibitor 10-like [Anopheles merus]